MRKKIWKFLIKLSKYTKIDLLYITKGGFWLILNQLISIISGFLLAIAFANLLPKDIYGIYKYILSLVSIIAIPTLPGINTAIVRSVAQGYEGSFIPGLKSKLQWGVLSTLISLGLSLYYFLQQNSALAFSFLIAAPFIPLMYSFNVYTSFWSGKKNFKLQSKYNITTQIISVFTLIFTLLLTKNIFIIILVYFLSHSTLRFLFLKLTLKKIENTNKKEDKEAIRYGKHLTFMGIVGTVGSQLDKILLWHYLGATSLAVYSLAILPPKRILELLRLVNTLALPKFSQQDSQILRKALPRKILIFFCAALPITVIYIVSAPFLYKLFFPQYLESVFYSRIFSLTILLYGNALLTTYLNAQMKIKELYVFSFVSSITKITLMVTLVPFYKTTGVILAILLTGIINFFLLVGLIKKSS